MENKRKYERYKLECTGLALITGSLQKITIHDISQNGVQFSFHHDVFIAKGDLVRLYFYDRDSSTLCTLDATVARVFEDSNHYWAVGVTFSENIDTIKQVIGLLCN